MIRSDEEIKIGEVIELDEDSFLFFYYDSFFKERDIDTSKMIARGIYKEKIEVVINDVHYFIMKIALKKIKRKKYSRYLN